MTYEFKALKLIALTLAFTITLSSQGYAYYEDIPDLSEADLKSEGDLIIIMYAYECSANAMIGPAIEKSLPQENIKTRKVSISNQDNILLKLATIINRPFNYHKLFPVGNTLATA